MNNKYHTVVDKDYAAFIGALPKELSAKLSFRDLRLIRRALPDGWTGAKRIAELEAEVERLSGQVREKLPSIHDVIDDNKFVCENHPDKSWPYECECGAGMMPSKEPTP